MNGLKLFFLHSQQLNQTLPIALLQGQQDCSLDILGVIEICYSTYCLRFLFVVSVGEKKSFSACPFSLNYLSFSLLVFFSFFLVEAGPGPRPRT
jgi:hypothetical protein